MQDALVERKPSALLLFPRLLKLLLRKLVRLTIDGLRGFFAHKVSSLVILGMLGGLAYPYAAGLIGPPPTEIVKRGDSLPPAFATEEFVRGLREFNAQPMWNVLSDDLKKSGQYTAAGLQAKQQQLRGLGVKVSELDYVGGYSLKDGGSVYLYIITYQAPSQTLQATYLFHVGTDGKIESMQ